ncbi:hypothetical protein EPO04_02710 [Patescibacteria group bacterium]|nr:MAG: hypothetical protein EPO04_02710 [Patescibacteria group bacterium]
MEPDKPVRGKKRAATVKSGTRKGLDATPASSAHVIDLRQHGKSAIAAPTEPTPAPAAVKKPQPEVKPRKEEPAPVKPPEAPPVQPIAPQPDDLVAGEAVDVVKVQSSRKRFWGAFIRFILLLIILGGLVFGGVYLYLTMYQK